MDRYLPSRGLAYSLALLLFLPLAVPAVAQDADMNAEEGNPQLETESYMIPSQAVMDAVLAPRHENVNLSNLDPTGQWFLRSVGDGLPPLTAFAKRSYDLGQFQVDPAANRHRNLTRRSDAGLQLISTDGATTVEIDVPAGARVSGGTWSPDGTKVAFFAHFGDATHIYVADAPSGDSRQVTRTPVLATWVTNLEWTADSRNVRAILLPEGRGGEPVQPAVPETPKVRLTSEDENKLRVYFDLLESPYEMELVEYYSTGQLALIDVNSRDVQRIGEPGMIRRVDTSPDGQYFMVTTLRKPFSYIVPVSSSASVEELWDLNGDVLATIEEQEVREGVQSQNGNGNGGDDRRGLTWRVDGPGLAFLQMEPRERPEEGEEQAEEEQEEEEAEPRKDRVMHWLPPFGEEDVQVVYETEERIASFAFDEDTEVLFLTRRRNGNGGGPFGFGGGGAETVSAVLLDDPSEEYTIYEDSGELTEDQGSLMRTAASNGVGVVRTSSDGGSVFLSGTQYFEEYMDNAPRPFIDRVAIRTGDKERIFQSAEDVHETMTTVLDDDATQLVVRRQSPSMVPNQWIVNTATGAREQITRNRDLHPQITAARREVVFVTRPDGFESRVEITLPANYMEGTKLPAMFWFYPREYTEQEDYDETLERYNKNAFPNVATRSMDILTLLGYAVIEPDLPIVGDPGQMNNNYVQDLRNTLYTVIEAIDDTGWIDTDRLGIGGHSYGAFGTANAMMHTPFFKAGIAGDGNYNRTLTPVGFQSERRELWEAQEIYLEMSPLFHADQMTGALLMYHGEDDHNVGTHPMHSTKLFHSLNALGKTASLYMYPYEDHGPATLETTLDLWARWTAWLEEYLGEPGQRSVTFEDGAEGSR